MIVTIFLIVSTLVILAALTYAKTHATGFFPGVAINNQSLKNISLETATLNLQNKVDEFIKNGLNYRFNGQTINIYPAIAGSNPDTSYQLINFDVPATVEQAYLVGRKKGYTTNFKEQLLALVFGKNIGLNYQMLDTDLEAVLRENLSQFINLGTDARPQIADNLEITILPEATGTNFDFSKILNESKQRINNLSSEPLEIELIIDEPQVKQIDINEDLILELKNKLANGSLNLIYQKNSWVVPIEELKKWLVFSKTEGKINLGLDASTSLNYLKNIIAPKIFKPTLEAKFSITNGRVAEFQGSQDGQELDIAKSLEKIQSDYLIENLNTIPLTVNETKAKVSTDSQNDLGIAQIIGTGQSNFKGSPKNRRHNIATGAAALNGVLIKPGETFSLISALGEIDGENGYLQELVIKGDRTIPEYGGGLCQIGTTVFRAALASGLPITERHNHSYRVAYYEPAGKDATIYSPRPDLKFTNDTAKHILIQSRISGDDIYFDFWGTTDGRIAEQTDSVVYNIRSAGPVINIETDTLKPGEKKCTETAHAGADAYFDYKVTYPGGEVKEERFSSHYIPWPAKCLIGKLPTPEITSPTSTLPVVQ
ncbi:MAG: VanW family protein [Patescibacteria group bacterium]